MPKSSRYIPSLDGLRGVAILLVMAFHTEHSILKGGYIGVDIFFVLSGFLITSLLTKEYSEKQTIDLKSFYWRRSLRLLPALLLLLSLYILASIVFFRSRVQENIAEALIAFAYLSNWVRAFQIQPPNVLGHTWSLAAEAQFYLGWSLLYPFLCRHCKKWTQVLGFTVLLAALSCLLRIYMTYQGYPVDRLYNGLDVRADGLLIGCALGILLFFKPLEKWNLPKWMSFVATMLLIAIVLSMESGSLNYFYWGCLVAEICTVILIIDAMSPSGLVKQALEVRWLVWVGSISYGLYLWHPPIFRIMQLHHFPTPIILLFGGGLTFAIAAFSFYFIERPILRLKQLLSRGSCKSD